MALKWKKLGERTWFGEDGSYRYTIDQRPFNLGGVRHYISRGGIASGDSFGSCSTLPQAKKMAQEDATKREDRVMALPDFNIHTFCQ